MSVNALLVVTPPGGEWSIAISLSVCLSVCVSVCVCLSVRDHISGTTGWIFAIFCVQISYGRDSVVLWRRCDTLCTSGFMDDVMFTVVGQVGRPTTISDTVAESDVYECLVSC